MNNYMVTFKSYGDICDMFILAANRVMAMEMFEEMTSEWNEKPMLISCVRVLKED